MATPAEIRILVKVGFGTTIVIFIFPVQIQIGKTVVEVVTQCSENIQLIFTVIKIKAIVGTTHLSLVQAQINPTVKTCRFGFLGFDVDYPTISRRVIFGWRVGHQFNLIE
ncbi:hypothetical protein D3C85_1131630 [compost metagenome]